MKQFKNRMLGLSFTVLAGVSAHAGQEKGGGHLVEAGFKAAAIQLSESLAKFPRSAAAKLKFNPAELLAASYGITPTCAEGADLALLITRAKMAYFKGDGSTTVLLDCQGSEDGMPAKWQQIFALSDTSSQILIAHEVLRTMGVEGESTYLQSGSIATATVERDKLESDVLETMIFRHGTLTCKISVRYDAFFACSNVKLSTLSHAGFWISVWKSQLVGSPNQIKNAIIDPSHRVPNSVAAVAVEKARLYGCFSDLQ